jgi:predicted type IV restriction endonuclease
MDLDRTTTNKLKRYAQVLREARDRSASEADTVVLLTKLLEDVLGYDPLAGEISREQQIQGRYCDIAVKVAGEVALLIEAKQAGSRLGEKEIEQAENYASRSGIEWVALTNGNEWQVYHVTFAEGEGITHELAFAIDLVGGVEGEHADIKKVWDTFGMLSKAAIADGDLDEFWAAKTALNPAAVVRALFSEGSIAALRRELRRTAGFMLTVEDVFDAVRDVLSKEALMAAGDIRLPRKKKRRKAKSAAPATPPAAEPSTPTQPEQTPAPPAPTAQAATPPSA